MLFAASSLGEHRAYPLSTPLHCLPGDLLTTDGRKVYLIRGGSVVQEAEATGEGTLIVPGPVLASQTISSVTFFRSRAVPGKIATITGIVQDVSGTLRIQFASGTEREFEPTEELTGVQRALQNTQYLDTQDQVAEDMAILKAVRSSPDGTNLGASIGLSAAVDFTANQEVIISV